MNKWIASLLLMFFCQVVLAQNSTNIELANEYYANGELEKAKTLYDNLAKNSRNVPLIHGNYFAVMMDLGVFPEAEKYLTKLIKKYPDNMYYQLDLGILYKREGSDEKSETYFKKVINRIKDDNYKVRITAQYLINKQLMELAIETYAEARRAMKTPLAYSLELANIYRLLNKKEPMVSEYLNYVIQNPSNVNYVKNSLQNLLSEDDELESLENLLYERTQKDPDKEIYSQLLIWVNLQQKNFYGAFIQARALDKRLKLVGRKVLDIGMIAMENGDYQNAIKIFEYIISTYPGTSNFIFAKKYLIESREGIVKNSFPVNHDDIRVLIKEYKSFIVEIGLNNTTMEALRNQALLYAFYLDEKDSAIQILDRIIASPGVDPELKASSKLDLGDIYVLTEESWESTLLYSQVEKSRKDTKTGYEAKLRNAKLSYYKGEFELAQEHLDILKMATTREIANDAMSLSILIQDNTGLDVDTTNQAMKDYAKVELMLFQNKVAAALTKVESMLNDLEGHSLTDELLMLKAKIHLQKGEFTESIHMLQQVVEQFDYDVLSDDAYYLMGTIYEEQLKNSDKAMEIYQDFLVRYPGSVYSADARKRFRSLRGDFKEDKVVN